MDPRRGDVAVGSEAGGTELGYFADSCKVTVQTVQ